MANVAAIVRGPSGYFGKNGVLYPPGALVPANPGVPEEDVSDDEYRMKEVEYEARNGDLRKRKVKVRIPFKPVPEGSDAKAPEEKKLDGNGTFNVAKFIGKNADDVIKAIEDGEVDSFLGPIEAGEAAKGKPRSTVMDAIKARRESVA